jgi:hypothetical protein
MRDEKLFVVEIQNLNRRIGVERALDDLIETCLRNGVHIESHINTTKELLERYMSVVRSRNKVRRNWHPKQARACDEITLELIAKDELGKIVSKRLNDALTVTTNGSKVILEKSLEQLAQEITNEAYRPKPQNRKPSPLEEIVTRIHRSNPEVTSTDVINEMKSNQRNYSISNMDKDYVEIEVQLGIGKDTKIVRRSLRSIGKILTNLNNP